MTGLALKLTFRDGLDSKGPKQKSISLWEDLGFSRGPLLILSKNMNIEVFRILIKLTEIWRQPNRSGILFRSFLRCYSFLKPLQMTYQTIIGERSSLVCNFSRFPIDSRKSSVQSYEGEFVELEVWDWEPMDGHNFLGSVKLPFPMQTGIYQYQLPLNGDADFSFGFILGPKWDLQHHIEGSENHGSNFLSSIVVRDVICKGFRRL